jgi:hypothetical protein
VHSADVYSGRASRAALSRYAADIRTGHSGRASRASPGEEERESSNRKRFVHSRRAWTTVPARARPVEPGSLGGDDTHV